jgi:protoporphyrinogen oxidase
MVRPGRTGMYYASSLFRLASPLDVLAFKPLSLIGRARLAMLLPAARCVRRWQDLDDRSAADWLRQICGEEVYRVVWEPLLRGKFGDCAETVSAAWFWSKLRLRGESRGRTGREQLLYFKGGFAALADALVGKITQAGGRVLTGNPARALTVAQGRVTAVVCDTGIIAADGLILTTPLPEATRLLAPVAPAPYVGRLRRIRHLSNRCLILELDRSLSQLYWVNVNDPSFPFVGVIEHTNFVDPATYGGRHIVYLSRYCAPDDPFLSLSRGEAIELALPYLKRMFPAFDAGMIVRAHSWQASDAQPVVEVGYSQLVPGHDTPIAGLYLATMAQVYPEDRGTNYAVRDGRKVAGLLAAALSPA